ncbi:predicted protein [Uncinocarpus reesii 1704]|uniref:3'-5' exonuclease domain-containing protein n=1 Tax=Uncinocarpus reesii (strain UAMH 1704) TaxID=336963 RepID=C4JL72_UNCRE|nr:uncharacterized protein UREG_03580 [Uncinocarpus reesii 1704]EEP78734.1 predicted protein [Uncinocarpus reesii 1704]
MCGFIFGTPYRPGDRYHGLSLVDRAVSHRSSTQRRQFAGPITSQHIQCGCRNGATSIPLLFIPSMNFTGRQVKRKGSGGSQGSQPEPKALSSRGSGSPELAPTRSVLRGRRKPRTRARCDETHLADHSPPQAGSVRSITIRFNAQTLESRNGSSAGRLLRVALVHLTSKEPTRSIVPAVYSKFLPRGEHQPWTSQSQSTFVLDLRSVVDSQPALAQLVDVLSNLPKTSKPAIFADFEGVNLCRLGSISIIQLLVQPEDHVYLIDVHVLGPLAFTTSGKNGDTLKTIFESPEILKGIFDVRNDSNALYFLYGVALQGVEDIQLMEVACRRGLQTYLSGLARCIDLDLISLGFGEKRVWKAAKEKGGRLFRPEAGGSFEVFNTRPMLEDIRAYCVCDVQYLPKLRDRYWNRLPVALRHLVQQFTNDRIRESQTLIYEPNGRHKALSPWAN